MLTKLELKFPQSMTFMRSVHLILHNIMCYNVIQTCITNSEVRTGKETLYCDIVEFILRFLLPVINKRGQEDKAHQQLTEDTEFIMLLHQQTFAAFAFPSFLVIYA